jgi:pyrroline-5-carboxylate reductase
MQVVGLIGAGNMARALARGWGEPVLCADPVAERAAALAADVGGEALASNREVAERADVVVLCHKPAQLEEVAAEIRDAAKVVVSILGGRALADVEAAYPGTPAVRLMPNTAVEVGRGVVCYVPGSAVDAELDGRLRELVGRLGTVFPLEDRLVDAATGINGVGPAYVALVVEAWADSGVKAGLTADVATRMATETAAGALELLHERDHDTLAVRRAVTSPGGITARGLAALERAGLRAAFVDAMDAVLDRAPRA